MGDRMPDRFDLARLRLERAVLSLPESIEQPSGHLIDVVVVSRLIIALNTVATILHDQICNPEESDRNTMIKVADFLWSVGETAAAISPGLRMSDAARAE